MSPMHECIIGIGSNIEPEKNIGLAIEMIRRDFEVVSVSELVCTSPIGIPDQPDFLNGALKVRVSVEKESFVTYLKKVEDLLHRDRTLPKYGPRTIDLDVVVWDGEIVDPDYYRRDFLKKSVDAIR